MRYTQASAFTFDKMFGFQCKFKEIILLNLLKIAYAIIP
jgi:hypothetical protein